MRKSLFCLVEASTRGMRWKHIIYVRTTGILKTKLKKISTETCFFFHSDVADFTVPSLLGIITFFFFIILGDYKRGTGRLIHSAVRCQGLVHTHSSPVLSGMLFTNSWCARVHAPMLCPLCICVSSTYVIEYDVKYDLFKVYSVGCFCKLIWNDFSLADG